MKKLVLVPVLAALVSPLAALADSTLVTPAGAGPATAQARLDFRVNVPRVLFLQVGTGSNLANGTTADLIDFTVPATGVTGGAATTVGGDLTGGAVTVRVLSNGSGTQNVTLNSFTTGQMKNAAGQTIGWNQITVAKAPLAANTPGYNNIGIDHPTFNNSTGGGNGSVTTLAPTAGVVNVEGKWTFAYANTAAVAAGTYGGVGTTNNGRVVYTATSP
ncbi:hypothetical protein QTH90_17560 [Variovorax sp. J2P1-59]|uniref:hypothetical protein n=1 Tax=Variovorax flavidus TaxID=3053501 RepID=UPI00257649CF|nr:hypothetical protein [Variovorax sp. J2P1-59]MDM0076219.1 hypothetical protein [Variovorax sp. J2P1-59]